MHKKKKAEFVLQKLEQAYPNLQSFLSHKSAFELLISTILSAQCTDARVNLITPKLFSFYPTPEKMAKAELVHLKKLIRSCGYFNAKSKNIKEASLMIVRDFEGKIPDTMEKLLLLPGVGRKTANVVLSQWFGKDEGIAVDTHVARLSRVLGLSKQKDPDKIERDLMKLFPQDKWNFINLALIQYGRDVCPARKHDESKCWLGHSYLQ